MSRILIADDEPQVRLLLERILEPLEDEGVELLFAHDGEQAVDMAVDHEPELMFLDVMMPRKNGFEVCRELREERGLRDVRIVILTALGQERDREQAATCGADLYLSKPFSPLQVEDLAREVLGLAEGA